MSATVLYKFTNAWDAVEFARIKNSFASAPVIWKYMEDNYLPPYRPDRAKGYSEDRKFYRAWGYGNSREEIQPVWDLYKREDIPDNDIICHVSTFDKVIVNRENIPKVIEAFRKFPIESSLKEQADLIEKECETDKDFIAIWRLQTTVVQWRDSKWWYDEETDDSKPYNILTMDDHYEMFTPTLRS